MLYTLLAFAAARILGFNACKTHTHTHTHTHTYEQACRLSGLHSHPLLCCVCEGTQRCVCVCVCVCVYVMCVVCVCLCFADTGGQSAFDFFTTYVLALSFILYVVYTHTHTHTHTRTDAHTHAHADVHARMHAPRPTLSVGGCVCMLAAAIQYGVCSVVLSTYSLSNPTR